MIDVHYWPTPNGWKMTTMPEEWRTASKLRSLLMPLMRTLPAPE
jgi:hypothetical protein